MSDNAPLSEQEYSKLRWRCRRGLLENDLFIARFFERCGAAAPSVSQAQALYVLMELADNDLLDLFLRRKQPEGALDTPQVHALLAQMCKSGPPAAPLRGR